MRPATKEEIKLRIGTRFQSGVLCVNEPTCIFTKASKSRKVRSRKVRKPIKTDTVCKPRDTHHHVRKLGVYTKIPPIYRRWANSMFDAMSNTLDTMISTRGDKLLVDEEDREKLLGKRLEMVRDNTTDYVRVFTGDKSVLIHHIIIGKPPTGYVTDHINGNGFDNRRSNLRFVTHRGNAQNRHVPHSSKYCGVTWHKQRGKWAASISLNGHNRHLGLYDDEVEAHQAYVVACSTLV